MRFLDASTSVHGSVGRSFNSQILRKYDLGKKTGHLPEGISRSNLNPFKQGFIHGSISRVRVGRGSMVAGQGQQLKFALL